MFNARSYYAGLEKHDGKLILEEYSMGKSRSLSAQPNLHGASLLNTERVLCSSAASVGGVGASADASDARCVIWNVGFAHA